jgi:acetylornithine deacetylase
MPVVMSDKEVLEHLVGFDSTSHRSNEPIAQWIQSYCDRPGIKCETFVREEGKVNLVLTVGPESVNRRGLVLSGHMDVVPALEPDWTGDPFTLREVDGRYVGRGACDMKGFVSLIVNRLVKCDANSLTAPLVVILTCDEEIGTMGAASFARQWSTDRPLPVAAIIGEPTSMKVVRMHKGHLRFDIVADGVGAHTGSPHLGANAISRMTPVLVMLEAFRKELEASRDDVAPFFREVPFPVLSVSRIRGGTAINIMPQRCVVECGVRLMPGTDSAPILEDIRRRLAGLPDAASLHLTVVNESDPLLTNECSRHHRQLCTYAGQAESLGVSYATDGGPLARLGLDCVICGPGDIGVAHKPDEWIEIDEYDAGGRMVDAMIAHFCQEGGA